MCIDDLDLGSLRIGGSSRGRVKTVRATASSGRYVRSAPLSDKDQQYDLAVDATLRAAMLRHASDYRQEPFTVTRDDFRKKVFKRPLKTLIIFVVDASDSMGDDGTYVRIRAAKGVALAMLDKVYQKRHRVGMVTFRDDAAEVCLQPTSSLVLAERSLKALPTGGSTPFADGLMKAWQLVKTERLKDKDIRPLLVVLSDGEANVPYDSNRSLSEVMAELLLIGGRIGRDDISSMVIDTRPLRNPSPAMHDIADALGGKYHHISSLKAGGVLRAVIDFS